MTVTWIRRCLSFALFAAALMAPVSAHDGDDDESTESQPARQFPPALVLPEIEGPKPWSDKPLLDDANRFHIAIMTDRTGGHRPGIWMKAVRRLNLLRPDFVMSVGDLIEGYTTDRAQLDREWTEFLGFIDEMQMKFFFVAGNHDVNNPVMHEVWRQHFGRAWYSFDYKGVHFVCLCSEDPETRIGDEQLAWVEEDLQQNKDARWTLVYLHKPLWTTAEREICAGNEDPTNWKRVETAFGLRPHTVFSGHVHHYVQYDRNGMKYYHLGTTGGGSQLRGLPYGEFDHVTWLTMESDGPYVTNLLLDGIVPADAVTEEGIARFRSFLAGTRVEIAPILISDRDGFSAGAVNVRLTNGFDSTVKVAGRIEGLPLRGLTVDPEALELVAGPGETSELSMRIQFTERISFSHLAQTLLTANLRTPDLDPPLSAERTIPVIIDARHDVPAVTTPVEVDGRLAEWSELTLGTSQRPLVIGDAENWNGPCDASLRLAVARDEESIYVAARVTDDRVLAGRDGIELRLDARPITARASDSQLGPGAYLFRVTVGDDVEDTQLEVKRDRGDQALRELRAGARRSEDGYDVELAIPVEFVSRPQSGSWSSFQASVVVNDVDDDGEGASRIVWRGTGAVEQRNTNFAQFVPVE